MKNLTEKIFRPTAKDYQDLEDFIMSNIFAHTLKTFDICYNPLSLGFLNQGNYRNE